MAPAAPPVLGRRVAAGARRDPRRSRRSSRASADHLAAGLDRDRPGRQGRRRRRVGTARRQGSTSSGRIRTGFNSDLPHRRGLDRSDRRRHLGRVQGLAADDARHLAARLPDRRALGGLSRGICAAEPLDRPDRGLDQQSRRGAVDHLRPARPRRVPQLHAPAALGAARRRPDAGADDHAGDRHRRPQRDQVGAALDPRRRARRRRQPRSRSSSTTSCRWRCPASSPARSSAWRARSARPRRC